jgi:uncharacterized protein (TIGR02001 family)
MMKSLEGKTLRVLLVVAVIFGTLSLARVPVWAAEDAAAEDKPTANIYVDVLSQYIFRGIAFSKDSAVIQPSVTGSYKGFSLNVWGNLDTHEPAGFGEGTDGANWNETDLTFSYSRELFKGFTATVGTVYYGIVGQDSLEVMAGVSYAFPWITVGVTGYREVWHLPAWWLQFDLSHTFNLPWYGLSIDTAASFGYFDSDDEANLNKFSGLLSGQVSAALNVPVGKYFVISPKIGVAFPLSNKASETIEAASWDGQDTHVFGGIRLSASF